MFGKEKEGEGVHLTDESQIKQVALYQKAGLGQRQEGEVPLPYLRGADRLFHPAVIGSALMGA